MDTLEFLIDPDILDVAYLVFKKKLENGKDEKESFIQMMKECILIHLSRLKNGISHKDFDNVAKELYDSLYSPQPSKEERVINSVCLSFRHDYGLLSKEEQENLKFEAREWLYAWRKHLDV